MLDRIAANVERYMDLLSDRQKLVAENIANVDTPGYVTKDIDFQTEFSKGSTGGAPQVQEVTSLQSKSDGNNVHLEREARLLSENALRFSVASHLARAKMTAIRDAIHSGRNG